MLQTVPLNEQDKDNARVYQQIWFLLSLGASAQEVFDILNHFRQTKSRTSHLLGKGPTRDPFRRIRKPEDVEPPNTKDIRNSTQRQNSHSELVRTQTKVNNPNEVDQSISANERYSNNAKALNQQANNRRNGSGIRNFAPSNQICEANPTIDF